MADDLQRRPRKSPFPVVTLYGHPYAFPMFLRSHDSLMDQAPTLRPVDRNLSIHPNFQTVNKSGAAAWRHSDLILLSRRKDYRRKLAQ